MKRLGPLVFEDRPDPPAGWLLGLSLAAVAAALVVAGLILRLYGQDPLQAYGVILAGTLGDPQGIGVVVERAIPLLLIGVGLILAFRAQFYNIGAEGQLLMGAVAGSGVALFVPLPGPLLIPAMFVAGAAGGAAWGLVPALLKLKLEVNEVITTLMLNYVAINLVDWLIHGPWKGRNAVGYAYSDTFRDGAWLPTIAGSRVHWPTLALGLVLAGLVAFVLARTVLGFRMRVLGLSPAAARYAGIGTFSTTLAVVLVSGGAAGLAGVGEVAGIHHKLLDPLQVSLGYGYTGIIVAWLARGNPVAAVLTALFLGLVFAGGDVAKVALQLPVQITGVINGLVLLFLISVEPLVGLRVSWARREVPAWKRAG